jgi:hypothetical protein
MKELLHPAAIEHLPAFITAPGGTDVLMVVVSIFLVLSILLFGSLFFRLHTMPERMAHRGHKIQFEIVAVLCLIALFTHIHLFWVAALLLALIDIPDFGGSLGRIAGSVEKMAGAEPGQGAANVPTDTLFRREDEVELRHDTVPVVTPSEGADGVPPETIADIRRRDGTRDAPTRPELAPARTRS